MDPGYSDLEPRTAKLAGRGCTMVIQDRGRCTHDTRRADGGQDADEMSIDCLRRRFN
ncbi:hypothetical protein F01_480003 [Burkholderia cenocepacia]|nr:hypothetical protein F01_480003 [Burkholderia cenocepacia]